MSQATPRQVLYALVASGFLVVVVILTVAAAVAGLVPTWWTLTLAVAISSIAVWAVRSWRRTGPFLIIAIGLFVVWTVGTLTLAG